MKPPDPDDNDNEFVETICNQKIENCRSTTREIQKNLIKQTSIKLNDELGWETLSERRIIIIIKILSNSQAINFASTNCSSCLEGKLHWDVVPIFVEGVFKAVDAFGVDNIFREFVPFVNDKTSSSGLLGFHLSRNSELVGMCAFYLIDP